MAFRGDDTSSGCSWIPTTPEKLGCKEQQLICVNSEENQSVQGKRLESERLIPVNQVTQINLTDSRPTVCDFPAESPYQNIPACCSSNSANVSQGSQVYGEALCNFDIWRSEKAGNLRIYGEGFRVNDKFSMNDTDQWVNMSFMDLLALADGGSNIMSFGNSLTPNAGSLLGGRFDGGNSMPETPLGGTSIPCRHSFDHNTMPRAALSNSTLSHFEPITPEKNWQMEQRQDSTAMQELSKYDGPTKEAQNNTVTREEIEGHNENKKQSQLAIGQLCENHKPDKEGTEDVDITKTPQQKSRRKKHRPKVIKEGKTKSTPKPHPEKRLGTQETRVKRKYTRRVGVINSISSPSQGEAIETDTNMKAAISKDTSVGKRQRTSRKAVDKAEATMDMGAIKTVDQMTGGSTRSSCRRSLNFDSVCQVRDECSMYIPSSNCNMESQAESFSRDDQSRTNVEHRQGKKVVMEKNDMGNAHRITGSIYHEMDDYLSRHEKCSPSSAPPAEVDQPQKDYCSSDRSISVKGKCQIAFSDVTNDKEVNNVQLTANISNDFIISSLLTADRLAGGLKRHMDTIAKAENYSNDSMKTLNNPIPRFSQCTSKNCGIPEMHFPVVYKRNGNEMGFKTTTNSQYSNVKVGRDADSIAQLLPSATNQGSSYFQCQAADMLIGNSNCTKDERQVFEDLLALGPKEKIRKRKSKAPTQVQNSTWIQEIRVSQGGDTKKSKNGKKIGQHAHAKALIADTSSPATKGHLKRILPNSIMRNGYNHHELPARYNGSPLAITWKQTSQIDSIVDQLNQLNLHAETSQVSTQNRHAFVAHHMYFQMQGAIVPYRTGGAVVAFDRSFDQVRRRQPRPKVDLDDETARVWKLLLENINSEGIDGTDEKNAKWWEEERRVFNGRAESFIARMHLVQGDRRFSPWKGSVVDSVVGVFLTQNVSDHLSSSAFMSLAARFPLKAKTIPAELHEARVGTKMDEPEICMLEPEETIGSNKNGVDNVKLLHDIENGDIRVVNSVNSLGNSFADSIAKEGLRDISRCSSVISHASVSNKSPSLNRDGQDMDEAVSSQTTVISSQNSADSPIAQTERTESSQQSHSGEDPAAGIQPNRFTSSTSFVKLLQMAGTVLHGVYGNCSDKEFDGNQKVQSESSPRSSQTDYILTGSTFAVEANGCSMSASGLTSNLGTGAEQVELSKRCSQCSDSSRGKGLPTAEISGLSVESVSQTIMKFTSVTSEECPNFSRPNDKIGINPEIAGKQMSEVPSLGHFERTYCKINIPDIAYPQNLMDVTCSNSNIDISRKSEHNEANSRNGPVNHPGEMVNGPKTKGEKNGKDKQDPVDWDALREQALKSGNKGERTAKTMDSVDWEAVRRADVSEVADAIKERGMNNKLAERIKDFLDRIVRDHESIDLEWLRDVPPDKAKEYLLSVRGLGLKSVECVRLLTLHQLAFPVDTNVGRIAVRLGWVPLQPLPESLQLHLLELYPVLESIQKYLWPRLCKLDQKTLYELHYQLITFGKVFCTKSRPNCNACPMRGECRHFASAFASARLALPAPEDKSIVSAAENNSAGQYPTRAVNTLELPGPQNNHMDVTPGVSNSLPIIEEPNTPEPIIELPATPETEDTQIPECDMEDTFYEDPDEIPSIQLNMEEFTQNLQKVMQQNTELQEGSMSNALVALTREAASIPVPKLKNVSRLRTEHQVYELPDSHPLLQGMEQREPDDPSPYLLAIWTPGETINSIEPPERQCSLQASEKLCTDETCSSCNSKREINSQTVRGTLLIPCRTAMRGSFPLNGTYFQVNEVFSDHESSLTPIDVPREWLWNLPRRTVYFGTSVPTIFKGLTTEQIQYCFWRGFVCVRGFDRKARAPRPLIARLHFPASKLAKGKGKTGEN